MLPANARQIDIDQMTNELKEKEVKIKWEERRIENSQGLSILEGLKRTIKEQTERQNQQAQQFKSLIDILVLNRAAALDNWSGQKEEQDATRILQNDAARGNVVSDIAAIEIYSWDARGSQKTSFLNTRLSCLPVLLDLVAKLHHLGIFTSEQIRALIPNLYQGISIANYLCSS
jgi:hypothetical protein